MIFQRYIIGPTEGTGLHGVYHSVSHLWEHGDGTSMFRVECDAPGFDRLNSDPTLDVLPSLNAPASAVASPKFKALLAKRSLAPGAGDTVLNALRQLRDSFGASILIDQPY